MAVLYHLLQAFCDPGDEVVYAWRSFEAYPIAVSATGAVSVQVPVDADGRHDLDAMAAAVTERTKVVVVCTPNNPTGPSVTDDRAARVRRRGCPTTCWSWSTRPTASSSARTTPSTGSRSRRHAPNVAVMRTFAKAYGLAGFRVGYARRARGGRGRRTRLCAAVRRLQRGPGGRRGEPGRRGGADGARRVDRGRARPRGGGTDGPRAGSFPEPQGNFVWLPLGDRTPDLVALAEEAGITVRPFAGEGVRVSIGEPEANDVFLRVAEQLGAH